MSGRHSVCIRRARRARYVLGVGALVLGLSNLASAQEYVEIRRLGTSNAISRPGPQTREDLQRVFVENRADYEKVLRDANWPGDPNDLFNAIRNGDFTEAQYPVGHTFEWMAVRKSGVAVPTGRIRWAGDDPFEAFEIRFVSRGMEHRFLIPKACGNLSLIEMRDAGPPPLDPQSTPGPRINLQTPNRCTGVNATIDVTIEGGMPEGARLELTLTRPSGQTETLTANPAGGGYRWQGEFADAGTYTVSGTLRRGSEASRTTTERVTIEPCQPTCDLQLTPPPLDPTPKRERASFEINMCSSAARVGSLDSRTVQIFHTPVDGPEQLIETLSLDAECSASFLMPEYGNYRLQGEVVDDRGMSATCQADYTLVEPEGVITPFFSLFGGNERRWRHASDEALVDETFEFDRSAPLVGGTFGIAFPFADDGAQVFGQGGVAVNLRDSENSSVFADVGVDKLFEGGFLGGGVGIWDINHGDTRSGSLFVHGGFNLNEQLQFKVEGRLFMNMLSMIDNNYLYLAGIRYFWNR